MMRRSYSNAAGRASSGARPLWSARYLTIALASAAPTAAWLMLIIRSIVRSQFSGLARRYEMRDIRLFASGLWHPPHLLLTRSLSIGIPASAWPCARAPEGTSARLIPPVITRIRTHLVLCDISVSTPLDNSSALPGDLLRDADC